MSAPCLHLHLPEEVILEHTAATGSRAAALAAACHLEACAACRRVARDCEGIAGALLESLPGAPSDAVSLEALLGRLAEPQPSPAPAPLPPGFEDYPAPLRQVLGQLPGVRWRPLLPGLRVVDLPLGDDGVTARLVRFRRRFVIPRHDHAGPELTVILSGSIADEQGVASAGDVVARDPGDCHAQEVGDDGCVALVVNEGPLVPLTRWGRLLRRLTGI